MKPSRLSASVAVLSAAAALFLAPLDAVGAPVHFQITDLDGAATEIPAGLPRARVLLLLGFRHDDHAALEGWREGMGLSAGDSDWFEVPVIDVSNALIRGMILRGMRSGVTGAADRARFAPAFADTAAIARQLEVDPSAPAAVVVDRTGRILAHASGVFDPAKAAVLIHVLRP